MGRANIKSHWVGGGGGQVTPVPHQCPVSVTLYFVTVSGADKLPVLYYIHFCIILYPVKFIQ